MNQKVIPISLRLHKNKNWNSKWIVEKNDYSKIINLDLNIKKYFYTIFNYKKIKLIKLNINKISNNLYINIFFYKKPLKKKFRKNRKKKLKLPLKKITNYLTYYSNYNIKLSFKRIPLRGFHRNKSVLFYLIRKNLFVNPYVKKMIYIFGYSLYTKNLDIITNYIKQQLEKKKYHRKLIKQFHQLLNQFYMVHSTILGFKLQFKGRINSRKRKNRLIFKNGKLPLTTLKHNIFYSFNEFKTPSGICSIKIFVFYKKNTKQEQQNLINHNFQLKKKFGFFNKKKNYNFNKKKNYNFNKKKFSFL